MAHLEAFAVVWVFGNRVVSGGRGESLAYECTLKGEQTGFADWLWGEPAQLSGLLAWEAEGSSCWFFEVRPVGAIEQELSAGCVACELPMNRLGGSPLSYRGGCWQHPQYEGCWGGVHVPTPPRALASHSLRPCSIQPKPLLTS